jgi:hypothetical protein
VFWHIRNNTRIIKQARQKAFITIKNSKIIPPLYKIKTDIILVYST